jgi:hypothetical protein
MCQNLLMLWTLCSHRELLHIFDLDGDTFDSDVLLSFISGIGTDRPSTSDSRDIDGYGSSGGPS